MDGQLAFDRLLTLPLWQWGLFLMISGVGFAYIQVTYMKAIAQIGAVQTSFFLSLNPIFTYLESLVFLQESFDFIHFVSFLLLILALIITKQQNKDKE